MLGQGERAQVIEAQVRKRLARPNDHCWVLVSLVPDMPGDLLIDHAALQEAQRDNVTKFPAVARTNFSWHRMDVGLRCIMLSGSRESMAGAKWLAADLYSDGAGIFAMNAIDVAGRHKADDPEEGTDAWVHDEEIVNSIISGLRFLARHARDRAGAGGEALIRAAIPDLGDDLVVRSPGRIVRLSCRRGHFSDTIGRPLAIPADVAQAASSLDALADDGPGLVNAAYLLATDLFQQFGLAETPQITRHGELRRRYWGSYRHQELQTWADEAGIMITDEELPWLVPMA